MSLYVLPGACSLASHITPEVAADVRGSEQAGSRSGFDVVVVQHGRHREPDYLAVNPHDTVPALVTRDGKLVVESLAVRRRGPPPRHPRGIELERGGAARRSEPADTPARRP